MVSKDNEAEELRNFLNHEEKKEEKVTSIIYDKRQYSVRIPLKFAKSANINPQIDKFKFTLIVPPAMSKDHYPKIVGELIYGEDKEKNKQVQ